MLVAAILTHALAADLPACAAPVSAAALQEALAAAEDALRVLDAEGFLARSDALILALPCTADVLDAAQAARVHRLQGLRLYIARDEAGAAAAFAAARRADPSISLTGIVPEGHALHELFGLAPTDVPMLPVPRPREGSLRIDGVVTGERGDHRPALLQLLARDGDVRTTDWVPMDGLLPPYDAIPLPPRAGGPVMPKHRVGRGLLGVGIGLTLAAGAFYAAGASGRASFFQEHETWTRDDLDRAQRRTNTWTTTAAILGGAGISTGTVGVVLAW